MLQYWGGSYQFAVTSSYDADAQAYIQAVEAADGQALETAVRDAINAFVVGCKADGIWSAIKASCILAGARTLAGCLVPLVGTAPTNSNFVSGDYNRKTGLLGNGTNKWLNSNRNSNADPQNSYHNLVHVTQHATNVPCAYIGSGPVTDEVGASNFGRVSSVLFVRNRASSSNNPAFSSATGLVGTSRQSSTGYIVLTPGSSTITRASQTPYNGNVFIFSTTNGALRAAMRASFYSIGEYLDPSLLATRTATLMAALAAAIP